MPIWVRFGIENENRKKSFVNSWLLSRTLDSGIHNLLFDFVKHVDFLITKKSRKNLPPTEQSVGHLHFFYMNWFVGWVWRDIGLCCWQDWNVCDRLSPTSLSFWRQISVWSFTNGKNGNIEKPKQVIAHRLIHQKNACLHAYMNVLHCYT